jgi:hypothetical protein
MVKNPDRLLRTQVRLVLLSYTTPHNFCRRSSKKGCSQRRRSCLWWPEVRRPEESPTESPFEAASLQDAKRKLAKYRAATSEFESLIAGYSGVGARTDWLWTESRSESPNQAGQNGINLIKQAEQVVARAETGLHRTARFWEPRQARSTSAGTP